MLPELAVLLRKPVNWLKEGALGKRDKSISEPIFIISLMIVLKPLDGEGKERAAVTPVLINGLEGVRSEGVFGKIARKVYEVRPLASRQGDGGAASLQARSSFMVLSFFGLVWACVLPRLIFRGSCTAFHDRHLLYPQVDVDSGTGWIFVPPEYIQL